MDLVLRIQIGNLATLKLKRGLPSGGDLLRAEHKLNLRYNGHSFN